MNLRRHAIAAAVAILVFLVLSLMSGPLGLPVLYALLGVGGACTGIYFHYKRRAVTEDLTPVTPARDDRVIPQDVKVAVSVRDKGKCQLRYPGCLVDAELQFDHVYPWSKGGSSKDPDNIQLACSHCNRIKSDKVPV